MSLYLGCDSLIASSHIHVSKDTYGIEKIHYIKANELRKGKGKKAT